MQLLKRSEVAAIALATCLFHPWIACADGTEKADHYNATKSSLHTQVKRVKHSDTLNREKALLDCLKKATDGSVKPCDETGKGESK